MFLVTEIFLIYLFSWLQKKESKRERENFFQVLTKLFSLSIALQIPLFGQMIFFGFHELVYLTWLDFFFFFCNQETSEAYTVLKAIFQKIVGI